MTDRELLEDAAKAAGYLPVRWDNDLEGMLLRGIQDPWNPLADDGDALRLAVKLGLAIQTTPTESNAFRDDLQDNFVTHNGSDPYAATRRAIVRAAASLQ